MSRRTVLTLVFGLVGLLANRAFATFDVNFLVGSGTGAGTLITDGTSVIITTSSATDVSVEIKGSSTGASVGDITVNATGAGTVYLWIGAGSQTFPAKLASVGKISSAGGTSIVQISYLFTEAVGDIDVVSIYAARATSFNGHVVCAPASSGQASSITSIQGHQILGNVTADYGTIGEIILTNNTADTTIGLYSAPVCIRAATINYVQADSIYADISGPSGNELGEAVGGIYATHGPFVGSLRMDHFILAGYLQGVITAGANLDADITIAGDVDLSGSNHPTILCDAYGGVRGVFPAGRTITIGGKLIGSGSSLDTNKVIDVPANGLRGQVIINANNTGSSPWWTAPVKVDGNSIDETGSGADYVAPHYNATSASLGKGAVGLVPYYLDGPDCDPVSGTFIDTCSFPTRTWNDESVPRQTIVLRHYGPIFDSQTGDSDPPLIIETQSEIGPPGPWSGDVSGSFDVLVHPPNADDETRSREVWIAMPLDGMGNPQDIPAAYNYRISLRNDGSGHTDLRCAGTFASSGSEPNVEGYYYTVGDTVCIGSPNP